MSKVTYISKEEAAKEQKEKTFDVVIIFTDGHREHHDFSYIKIFEGCLVVIDPLNEIPCEVHCFPLSVIQSFIFDADVIKTNRSNIKESKDATVNKSEP